MNASINNPVTLFFDKKPDSPNYRDLSVTLSPGSFTLLAITYGTTTLQAGVDYTVSGNIYTFKKEYLATLDKGDHIFTFEMSGGINPEQIVLSGDTPYIPLPPPDYPGTGDYGLIGWLVMLSTALFGAAFALVGLKRRQQRRAG
jgi:hypothetical protein